MTDLYSLCVGVSVRVSGAPCDRQLDVVQQVLAAVTNRAGLEALTVTGDTPGGERRNNIRETHDRKVKMNEHRSRDVSPLTSYVLSRDRQNIVRTRRTFCGSQAAVCDLCRGS